MAIYKLFLKKYSKNQLSTVSCFDTITQAKEDSKSGILIRNINDLIDNYSTITSEDMVELYNSLMNLFEQLRNKGIIRKIDPEPTKKPKFNKSLNGEETRGRKSFFKGRKLTTDLIVNPRRRESHGFNSLDIVIKNKGLTYEDFISKGGRRQDLAWDLAKGRIRFKR